MLHRICILIYLEVSHLWWTLQLGQHLQVKEPPFPTPSHLEGLSQRVQTPSRLYSGQCHVYCSRSQCWEIHIQVISPQFCPLLPVPRSMFQDFSLPKQCGIWRTQSITRVSRSKRTYKTRIPHHVSLKVFLLLLLEPLEILQNPSTGILDVFLRNL